jgi:hypothetical protein
MRIKIVGDNNCARATRHLLRKAGFAVTEFLPADVVTQAPHSGYAITIDLAPAPHNPSGRTLGVTPDPTQKPGPSTHGQAATEIEEASAFAKARSGASSPTSTNEASQSVRAQFTENPSLEEFRIKVHREQHAVPLQHARTDHHSRVDQIACIHFDSVDSALEAAILRHVTQLAAAPVIVDRPGGVVHSERELRIIVPNSGDAKADEAAAVAVEFGVLRGLLDLNSPAAPTASRSKLFGGSGKTGAPSTTPSTVPEKSRSEGGKKWWRKVFSRTALKIKSAQAEACATKTGLISMISVPGKVGAALSCLRDQISLCVKDELSDSRLVFRGAGGTKAASALCWRFVFAALVLLVVAGGSQASPRRASVSAKRLPIELALSAGARVADRATLMPTAALLPQGQFSTGQLADPCKGQAKLYVSINQTANTQLVAGTAAKKIYICSIHVVVAVATSVALVEGTGSVCATGTAGVSGFGGATAATGWNFAVNGGIVLGNGDAAVGAEGTSADNLCLFNSGSGQVSGGISYVVQ